MISSILPKALICCAMAVLLAASLLPPASADTQALPTVRVTLAGGVNSGAATAAAAATRLAGTSVAAAKTASAASTKLAGTAPVAATSAAATANALATKGAVLKATITPPATTGAEAASQAITSYATGVLGITVHVKKAGGLTGDVNKSLSQTPKGSAAQNSVAKLAVTSYGAILSNGGASLSYGSGTVTGDVTVDVQGASLGVYSLAASYSGKLDAASALDLAKKTYPSLAGFSYTPQTVSQGYAWYAKGNVTGYNTQTKKFETMAEAVILYVLPASTGKATVTATVGRGAFAAAVKP